jgi:hypothetical protein
VIVGRSVTDLAVTVAHTDSFAREIWSVFVTFILSEILMCVLPVHSKARKGRCLSMKHIVRIVIFLLVSMNMFAPSRVFAGTAQKADWTIMVFMNAKNNLECAGLANFSQIATVGSNDHLNLVVELGRPSKNRYTNDEGGWTGVLRFRVTQNMHPVPSSAINPDDANVRNADMGDAATLADFVGWSEQQYPAQRYMLIIWNHGQGWRLYQTQHQSVRKATLVPALYKYGLASREQEPKPCNGPAGETLTGGVRSVSFDEDTGSFLYNRAIQKTLKGMHLDILGFDACLMAMLEAAYAFRQTADLMIASEELVPGDGWNYTSWLQHLRDHPEMKPPDLAKNIVQSYKEIYGDAGDTTLSVIELQQIDEVFRRLSRFSLLVKSRLATQAEIFASARLSFRTFGDWYADSWADCQGSKVVRFLGIDLDQFLTLYAAQSKDADIRKEAARTKEALKRAIVNNYTSSVSAGADHWATGLAIYFPSTELDYQCDPDKDGYNLEAVRAGLVQFPPEFVEKEGWADLLRSYLQWRKSPKAGPNY